MNKIFLYIMGVFSWFNALACSAVDMFEVLPDLPDPLAYAVQPAVASAVSGAADASNIVGSQSIGHEPSLISVFLSLAFVVLLIYLTGILYAKLTKAGFKAMKKQQGDLAKYQVSVVSTTQLGNNKTLHVVELDGKKMLIGASSSAIQLIKDLGSCQEGECEEEYSRIEIPNIKIPKIEIPKIEIPSIGFSKLITKAHKGLKEVEKVMSEDSKSNVETVVVEQNKDSLANGEGTAPLTFILKTIFTTTTFRNNMNFTWNGITGPLAGGWTVHNTIYPGIKNITFIDAIENDQAELLNQNIKEVLKITDFGPARTDAKKYEYYPVSVLSERLWTPSATEMGVLDPQNTEEEAQQGEAYIWFTNNESRIKKYLDEPERYWTRTWFDTYRFYGIGFDGGYAYDISLATHAIGILSYETAGLIFGFCV